MFETLNAFKRRKTIVMGRKNPLNYGMFEYAWENALKTHSSIFLYGIGDPLVNNKKFWLDVGILISNSDKLEKFL